MAVVLICSSQPLDRALKDTLLFRAGIEREVMRSVAEVQTRIAAGGVAMLCFHRRVPGIEAFIKALRRSPSQKHISIVVLSEDDFDPSEVEVLEAGANAILRLPPGSDFDERLGRLIEIPARREVRIPVRLEVGSGSGFGATSPVVANNLSASGILIESNQELSMGDEVSLTFRLEESGAIVSAIADITRTAGIKRYGAKFREITEGEEALKAFLSGTSRS